MLILVNMVVLACQSERVSNVVTLCELLTKTVAFCLREALKSDSLDFYFCFELSFNKGRCVFQISSQKGLL